MIYESYRFYIDPDYFDRLLLSKKNGKITVGHFGLFRFFDIIWDDLGNLNKENRLD